MNDQDIQAEQIADELSALVPILAACLKSGVRLPLIVEVTADAPVSTVLGALDSLCPGDGLVLSDDPTLNSTSPVIPPAQFRQHLGCEYERVIVDCRQSVHADALAASQGWVRGGGLWCLIIPIPETWSATADRDLERILAWPSRPQEARGLFLQRLKYALRTSSFPTVRLQQDVLTWIQPPHRLTDECPPEHGETQADAIEALVRLMRQRSRRPLVIRAQRGRGKSTALGIAAARILASRPDARIIATAPSRHAVQTLMQHFEQQRTHPDHTITFLSPDLLVAQWPEADLLVIDEAAALPASLVIRLVKHYRRVALATTTCGYEGSGQGFRLRLEPALRKICPGLRQLELTRPIRWSAGDALEPWVDNLFVQQTRLPDIEVTGDSLLQFRAVTAQELDADEALLSQCFTLLREAHYRTTPDDLKIILDAPSAQLFGVFSNDRLAGLIWYTMEGAFGDSQLIDAIVSGQRRPRGHVLPQLLAQITARRESLPHLWVRVVRIAVHPAAQRMGIGSLLLHKFVQHVRKHTPALAGVGAVFSGDPDVVRFWRRQQFRQFYLGTRTDAWTASHAVGMIRAFQNFHGLSEAYRYLFQVIRTYGPTRLADTPAELLDEALLSLTAPRSQWPEPPPRLALAYAQAKRPLDTIRPELIEWLFLCVETGQYPDLDPEFRRWSIALALQQHSWPRICRDFDHAHPLSAEKAYRHALQSALQSSHASDT